MFRIERDIVFNEVFFGNSEITKLVHNKLL